MSGPYHAEALERFKADPLKRAFQWWIRVVASERLPRETIPSLAGAVVRRVTNDQAREVILQYEWLGAVGRMQAAYGLFIESEILGVVCFGTTLGKEPGDVCGVERRESAICLERGTCVHYAPKNAASYLITHGCRLASQEFGWRIFYAYADDEAGEIGNVYQACNWLYIGQGTGRGPRRPQWQRPNGAIVSSKTVRADFKKSTGASDGKGYSKWAREQGYECRVRSAKHKYIHFEGDRREQKALRSLLRYPVLPYPKRNLPESDLVVQE